VARGLERAHIVADMPFMSYQVNADDALRAAGRLIKEGRAHSVKLEGGKRSTAAIERIVDAGIPVVGHIGLTPQSVHAMGGFRIQGRSSDEADRLVRDALLVQEAGAFALVLEGMPSDVSAEITHRLEIPTIGIGAGSNCDGQVLVCNDLLGLDLSFSPRFVKRFAKLQDTAIDAFTAYADEVRSGTFPGPEHSFNRKKGPRAVAKLY
jgi:3-methyl-2-oxobutanoate hydroxymethyltransferase